MTKFLVALAIVLVIYGGYRWFKRKPSSEKGGSGGGDDTKPTDPNYPAQG